MVFGDLKNFRKITTFLGIVNKVINVISLKEYHHDTVHYMLFERKVCAEFSSSCT